MSKIADRIFFRGERTCPWWLCFTFDNPIRAFIQNPRKIVSRFVSPDSAVLDIGPGKGYFTIPMAEMTRQKGRVVALDIQKEMLNSLAKKAEKKGLRNVETKLYDGERFGIDETFDFALLFWMFHEVRNKENFLKELRNVCKKDAKLLLVEPMFHVSKKGFQEAVRLFSGNGFAITEPAKVGFSRAIVLTRT